MDPGWFCMLFLYFVFCFGFLLVHSIGWAIYADRSAGSMVIFDVFYVRVCFFGLGHLPLKVEDWPWFGVSDDFGIVPYRRIQTLKLYCQKSLFGVYMSLALRCPCSREENP